MKHVAAQPIIGDSPSLRQALTLADRCAPTEISVLLVGATGTGKELFAQRVHSMSGRRGPLVDVNCAALPLDMVEGLLFGHRRGAFSGAFESAAGLVEHAHGGTLFLDELTSLPHEAQGKLLRVLESREVRRVGERDKRPVDFRLVAAVHDGVAADVERGLLRRDLYQRVAGMIIRLEPLSRRRADILQLAEHFASVHGQRVDPAAASMLIEYDWPGNVRELRQVIERARLLVENGTLSASAISMAFSLGSLPNEIPSKRLGPQRWSRRAHLLDRLVSAGEANGWHAGRMAVSLGIARSTLFYRLRAAGLSLRDRRRVQESK